MSREKELAYRYDLFIAPDWRNRFDQMIDEKVKLPSEGRFLDINCGTGGHAVEIAERLTGKGEIIAVDSSEERLIIARAKALIKKLGNISCEPGNASCLLFDSDEFDVVIGDASMVPYPAIKEMLDEMVRVAAPDGEVVLKMTTHGSFDEFFSIFWEALHELNIQDEAWAGLEALIKERPIMSEAVELARKSGLRNVNNFCTQQIFLFESGRAFLESPLIEDIFLDNWLDIVPADRVNSFREQIIAIIDRDRRDMAFEVSVKAAVITGRKV